MGMGVTQVPPFLKRILYKNTKSYSVFAPEAYRHYGYALRGLPVYVRGVVEFR